ncbi:MAG: hypothetical protein Q7S37_04090 [bacterium]|nr:hypothetical protein [bacterium]
MPVALIVVYWIAVCVACPLGLVMGRWFSWHAKMNWEMRWYLRACECMLLAISWIGICLFMVVTAAIAYWSFAWGLRANLFELAVVTASALAIMAIPGVVRGQKAMNNRSYDEAYSGFEGAVGRLNWCLIAIAVVAIARPILAR